MSPGWPPACRTKTESEGYGHGPQDVRPDRDDVADARRFHDRLHAGRAGWPSRRARQSGAQTGQAGAPSRGAGTRGTRRAQWQCRGRRRRAGGRAPAGRCRLSHAARSILSCGRSLRFGRGQLPRFAHAFARSAQSAIRPRIVADRPRPWHRGAGHAPWLERRDPGGRRRPRAGAFGRSSGRDHDAHRSGPQRQIRSALAAKSGARLRARRALARSPRGGDAGYGARQARCAARALGRARQADRDRHHAGRLDARRDAGRRSGLADRARAGHAGTGAVGRRRTGRACAPPMWHR